jgi:chromosome segregation ATPase
MARIGISYEQVAQIADTLVSIGQKPTISAIRAELGTGSPNTILVHLNKWRDTQPVKQKQARAIPDALISTLNTIIEQAEAQARAEVEAKLIETKQEVDALIDSMEVLESANERLEDEIRQANEAKDKALKNVVAHEATIAEMRSQAEQVVLDHGKKAIEQAKLLGEAKREADGLRVELAKAQIKAESATKLESEVAALRAEAAKVGVLEAQLKAEKDKVEAQRLQIEQLSETVHAYNSRMNKIAQARARL